MAWTEKRLEKFKRLYADNLSFLGIARELGGFSHCRDEGRNACIGMAHRLGLTSRKRAAVQSVPRLRRARSDRPVMQPASVLSPAPVARTTIPEQVEATAEYAIPFMDAENHHCHWPLWAGDEPIEERFYCGTPTANVLDGHPYCGPHSRMAFDGLGRGARPYHAMRAAE